MKIDFSAPIKDSEKLEIAKKIEFPVLDFESAKKRFDPYIQKIDEIFNEAQDLIVDREEANQKAVEIGTSVKKLFKQIEKTREQVISEPYNFVKSINSFVKIFTDKLYQIENLTKQKISQYRAFLEQKRREEELAARKATEELQKKLDEEAKIKGIEPVKIEQPIIPKQNNIIRSESGTAYARKFWEFRVIDESLIPREYLIPNETKIRKAILAGVREIPGIEIYQVDRTSFRVDGIKC